MPRFNLFDDPHTDADQYAIPPEVQGWDEQGERCENLVKIPEADPRDLDVENGMGTCGGRLKWINDHHYYNGQWDCVTVTVECEFCGIYDFEAV